MLDSFRIAQGLSRVASILGHEVFPAPFKMLGFSRGEVSLEALRMMKTRGATGDVEVKTGGIAFDNEFAGITKIGGPNRTRNPRQGREPGAVVGGVGSFLELARLEGRMMHEEFGRSTQFNSRHSLSIYVTEHTIHGLPKDRELRMPGQYAW